MKLAVVTGYVVCTVRHEGLAHDKLLMVEMLNARGSPTGNVRSPSTASARDVASGYCWSAAARRDRRTHTAPLRSICA